MANFQSFVLTDQQQQSLAPGQLFRECRADCPEMVVVEKGRFWMGSQVGEHERYEDEGPQHQVTIPNRFAVAKAPVTFAEWNACVELSSCPRVENSSFGEGTRPVINVSYDDAQKYVKWISEMTGRRYRLLSESEWEYAARAGTATPFYWGSAVGKGNAACDGCDSKWDNLSTAPVGQFKPNDFGLYDMAGNVYQWVEDCVHESYDGAPIDGSAWVEGGDCTRRQARGGSWADVARFTRSAARMGLQTDTRSSLLGFRVARSLSE